MAYRAATEVDIAFFAEHGWLVVEDAIDPSDLVALERRCDEIIANKETMAYDWAWDDRRAKDDREFKILQGSPSRHTGEFDRRAVPHVGGRVRLGACSGRPVEFWYDQFLAKPPQQERADAVAPGRGVLGPGPRRQGHHVLDAVPRRRRAQRVHALHRRWPSRRGADPRAPAARAERPAGAAGPTSPRTVACPIELGSVTFHHGKTPHMTTANTTDAWRRILTQHLKAIGVAGEGDHYPWKVYVNQFTGELITPETR